MNDGTDNIKDNTAAAELRGVSKSYRVGRRTLPVLRGIDWRVEAGKCACLLGASGSGKTTLLNIIGALERPGAGEVTVCGENLTELPAGALAEFRRKRIGFVFQSYHLLPELSILENAALPARLAGTPAGRAAAHAAELLGEMGLGDRLRHRPAELSGGEQQRAAIARALINSPELLLADEPTGNLDSATGDGVLALLDKLRAEGVIRGMVMITHNREVAERIGNITVLRDGATAAE